MIDFIVLVRLLLKIWRFEHTWQQKSWATAKMTAECNVYMDVLQIFESPWV